MNQSACLFTHIFVQVSFLEKKPNLVIFSIEPEVEKKIMENIAFLSPEIA